jgi:hypothetical protein
MLVQTRHETHAAALHHTGRFDSLFVVLKPLLGGEAGEPDVVASSAIPSGIAQVDDVDGVVAFRQTASTSSVSTAMS